METVLEGLTKMGLERYADKFDDEGYDNINTIANLDEKEAADMCQDVEMKKGHVKTFLQQYKQTFAANQEKTDQQGTPDQEGVWSFTKKAFTLGLSESAKLAHEAMAPKDSASPPTPVTATPATPEEVAKKLRDGNANVWELAQMAFAIGFKDSAEAASSLVRKTDLELARDLQKKIILLEYLEKHDKSRASAEAVDEMLRKKGFSKVVKEIQLQLFYEKYDKAKANDKHVSNIISNYNFSDVCKALHTKFSALPEGWENPALNDQLLLNWLILQSGAAEELT